MKIREAARGSPPARHRDVFFPKNASVAHVPFFQAQLKVGTPGDRFEREADAMADQVVQPMAAGRSPDRPASSIQAKCTACREEELQPTPGLSRAIDAVRDGGRPLGDSARSFFEPRFGVDLGEVRVHTDADAAQTTRALNARAFTVGRDVAFGRGEYAPESVHGRKLLAHELVHVIQQRGERRRVQRDIDQAALDQCIAELGGSAQYRDAGIASPEELETYRQECLRRQGDAAASSRAVENLRRAWDYARERLPGEVTAQVQHLFSPASLAAMAAFAALYIAAQFTPVGWVADAFALTLLTLTLIAVGTLVFQISSDLYQFFSAVNATSEDELRTAGHALARALARGGVGIFIALLSRGMRAGTPPPPTASAPALVEVAVAGGGRIRVPAPATTVGEAVEASRLQGLASYAVMVPPPGGSQPSSPTSSTGTGTRSAGQGQRSGAGSGPGGRGVGAPGGFTLSRIAYGQGVLSQLAQAMRLRLGLRRGGNVAVFEFENLPDRFQRLVARQGGRNVHISGNRMAVQNVNGSAHSEELAHELIQAGRRAGMELNVRRIYTEYNPCTDRCLPLIRQRYPTAEVTYSFIWEHWGRQTPDRNAAVDALFTRNPSGGGR